MVRDKGDGKEADRMPRKTALNKDIRRAISHSKGRFISILLLMALGSFALVGLYVTGPDMRAAGETYFDEYNAADLTVISDYGLDEDDVELINSVSGASEIEYSYFKDVVVENTTTSVRVYSEPEEVSLFEVVDGRLPETTDEVAIDTGLAEDYDIGDTIVFTEYADTISGETVLTQTEFTVVGYVNSVEILSLINMGQSTAGTGTLEGYAVVVEEVFDSDVYMAARLTFEDTEGLDPYSDEYAELVQAHREELEELLEDRPAARLATVRAEAQESIDEGQEEVDEAKQQLSDAEDELAEAEEELSDGQTEIDDAQAEIDAAQAEIDEAQAELDETAAEAQAELDEAAEELSAAEEELDAAKSELDEAAEEIAAAEETVASGQAAADEAQAALDEAASTLDATKSELDEAASTLDATADELDTAEDELAESLAVLEASQSAYDEQEAEYEEALAAYESSWDTVSGQWEAYESTWTALDASRDLLAEDSEEAALLAELDELKAVYEELEAFAASKDELAAELGTAAAELEAGWAEYDTALAEYEAGQAAYEEGLAEYEAGQAAYEEGLAEYEAGAEELASELEVLAEGEAELEAAKAAYEEGLAEYEAGLAEYEEGLAEYEAGVAELETSTEEAQGEIDAAQEEVDAAEDELADAKAELAEGQAEYDEALEEYETESADAEDEIAEAEEELAEARERLELLATPSYEVDTRLEIPGSEAYSVYGMVADICDSLARIFPVLLYLVAALVTLSTMTRMVDEERTNSGTLKALGYSDFDIAKKFLIYGALAGGLGSILGIALGHTLFPSIVYLAYGFAFTLPEIELHFYPMISAVAIVIAMLCSVLPAYVAVKHEMAEKPANLMVPKPPKSGSKIFLERIKPIWNRLSFTYKVTARNLFRYKQRMFMTIIGVAGAVCMLVAGFGVQASIQKMGDRQFEDLLQYDLIVANTSTASDDDLAEVDELLESDEIDSSMYIHYESLSKMSDNSVERQSITLLVTDDAESFSDYVALVERSSEEEFELGETGAVITERLADLLELEVGDTFEIDDADGVSRTITVTGITEMYMGHFMFMSSEAYEAAFESDYTSNASLVVLADDSDDSVREVSAEFTELDAVQSVVQNLALESEIDTIVTALDVIMWLLIVVATGLSIVIMYNLTNINVSERIRELSTIKVLGFHDNETTMYIYRETIVLTFIGLLVGFALGVALHEYILYIVPPDEVMFDPALSAIEFVVPTLLISVITVVLYFVVKLRLSRVDMLDALKSNE